MIAFRWTNNVFFNRGNSSNIGEHTLAKENNILPFEFQIGNILTKYDKGT